MKVKFNRRAVRDVEAIADYIRPRNEGAAIRVRDRIDALTRGLADFPFQGVQTDERDIRRLVATPFPYVIFYRVKGDTVIILHVRHGRRRPRPIGVD